jgi:hypothetical protein
MDTKIDYTEYSFDDLIDIQNNIDKDIFPDRYASIQKTLKEKYSYEEPTEIKVSDQINTEYEPYKLSDFHPSFLLKNIKLRLFCLLIVLASFNSLESAEDKGSVDKTGTTYEKGSMVYKLRTFKWEIILLFGVVGMVYPYHLHKK